jgi:phage tail-like protein
MADQRTYTSGRFAVTIGGGNVAFVKKFDGLAMEADIVSNDLGPENFQSKHVSNIKWTDGKVTVGTGMGKALYQWMQASFDKAYKQENGSVIAADFDYKAMSELTFQNAYISKCVFPKFDASSKDALYFDIDFSPETVRWSKGSGAKISGQYGTKQKAHLSSNFRFEMGGLPCDRVSTVDSITWTCAVALDHIGIHREPTKHAAKVTVSDVKVSVSMGDFEAWQKEAKKWFIDGEHLANNEMQGSITILGPDMKKEVGVIELKNCGFKKFSRGALEANSEKVARFDTEFYVEGIKLTLNEADA